MVSFPPASPPRPYTPSSPHPYTPHAHSISFSFLSPAQYRVRSTDIAVQNKYCGKSQSFLSCNPKFLYLLTFSPLSTCFWTSRTEFPLIFRMCKCEYQLTNIWLRFNKRKMENGSLTNTRSQGFWVGLFCCVQPTLINLQLPSRQKVCRPTERLLGKSSAPWNYFNKHLVKLYLLVHRGYFECRAFDYFLTWFCVSTQCHHVSRAATQHHLHTFQVLHSYWHVYLNHCH